jgi:hydroxymethylglutaryl-CoA reductase
VQAIVTSAVETATNSGRVRSLVAEAVALQLLDDVLANEIARQAARVEERACLNVKRGWSCCLAAARLRKKNRDEKVVVRQR